MRSGFFERWERISRAMRRNSVPSRKCPKAARHQTWDLCSRKWWAWVDLNHRPRPYQGSTTRFYNNLQDRGDCQNTRKSYKASYVVGWIVGWSAAFEVGYESASQFNRE